MKQVSAFVRKHVDPATRLGEILFGLIMALGFTGAVRLGVEEADNMELFKSILGCNIAWGIVDGAMHVLGELFERSRKARIVKMALATSHENDAIVHVAGELDERFAPYTSPEERREIYRWVLKLAKRGGIETHGFGISDILAGLAIAILITLCTLPVVLPFLIIADPYWAVRVSNVVAICLLFSLGGRWGKMVGMSPWRIGSGLALIGVVLVLVTIALGG